MTTQAKHAPPREGMTPTACHVCEGGALGAPEVVITQPDRFERAAGVDTEDFRRYWTRCARCGAATNVHMTANARAVAGLASAYYEIDFSGRSLADRFTEIVSLPAGRSDNAQRVQRIATFVERWFGHRDAAGGTRRILDIGAGLGVFLARILPRLNATEGNWHGVAVEPDPNAAAHLRSLGSFEVVESRFESGMELDRADLCTLNKVVEHVALPRKFMREVHDVVADDGVIYVEVPDVLTLEYRSPSDNILGSVHHHLYDPASLALMLSRADWTVLEMGRVFEPSGKITVFAFATTRAAVAARAVHRATGSRGR